MGNNPEFIKKMINYIIQEPDLEKDPKFYQKFPFISSEIFFLELDDIINAFFIESPLIDVISIKTDEKAEISHEKPEKIYEERTVEKDEISNEKPDEKAEIPNEKPRKINEITEENSEMMEKCMVFFSKIDRISPSNKHKTTIKFDDNEDFMKDKLNSFKPIENHFDLFKNSSGISLTFEKTHNYELLNYLFTFLEEKQINLTSAGYFSKVVHSLMNKRFMDVFICFF